VTQETFRSRFGLIVSLLGMAVGTGNIWRFPRVMAQNGGGAFLIPWFLFLFLWSIPLLVVEFALGQKLRLGVAGCFNKASGGKYTWLGAYVVLCTLGIMFYYSVVSGWCLYFLGQSVSGALLHAESESLWKLFSQSGISPLIHHFVAMGLTVFVVSRGVQKGIELCSWLMFPALYLVMVLLAFYSLTLPGRDPGLNFLYSTDFSRLRDYRVWLEALTQSAWSTGAGWGIALTYACYSRLHDEPVLTVTTTGLGNNSVELLAGMVMMPTLFSFFPISEVLRIAESGNTGLTFIALPSLFQKMPAGGVVAILFFIALFFAAFTSLFAMFELGVHFLRDLGLSRGKGIALLGVLGFLLGAPSALRLGFLNNQDWAWGIGLLLSGFFFSLLVRRIGIERFDREFVPLRSRFHRFMFELIVFWLIPVEFLALVAWWFAQAIRWDPAGWWNPFGTFSVGTCLFQWGFVLAILCFLNRRLSRRIEASS
jgi:NSS family neurotransmitter:Na+ symporter